MTMLAEWALQSIADAFPCEPTPRSQSEKNWIKKTNCHCTYDCAWSLNILGNIKYQPELIESVFGKSW